MAEFRNELSWSFSRDRLFRECKRAYYYCYYGSWGGWDKDADPLTRKLYVLKQQTNIPMFVGQVIHDAIAKILYTLESPDRVTADRAIEIAKRLFKIGWRESKERRWQQDPKRHVNLFEHYYGVDVHEGRLIEIGELLTTAIRNFSGSGIFEQIQTSNAADRPAIPKFDKFLLDVVTIFAQPDFALKSGDFFYLYDWKSGRETPEDVTQLACYGLYAVQKWGPAPDSVRAVAFYLASNSLREIEFGPTRLNETEAYIKNSLGDMMRLLADVARNMAHIDSFPPTDEPWKCQNCSFKEVCAAA